MQIPRKLPGERKNPIVSFIGYATQTVPVNGKTSLTITLKEDTEVLDEVVVIGYGTMKKSDLTGAISSVSSKDLMKQPSPSLGAALQGRATGLQVISSGAPAYKFLLLPVNLAKESLCVYVVSVLSTLPANLYLY